MLTLISRKYGWSDQVDLPRGQSLDKFLREPSGAAIRLVLFYGPDLGQISENGKEVLRQLGVKTDNDFQLSRLTGADLSENPGRLRLDANSQCLTGERRIVWLTSAGEGNKGGSQIQAWLKELAAEAKAAEKNGIAAGNKAAANEQSLVIAEIGDIPARSPLRTAVKSSHFAVAVACYPDNERDIANLVKKSLSSENISISEDALRALVANLGADRLTTRGEIEKFALYAGAGGRIELADVLLLSGDAAGLSNDDLLSDAALGLIDQFDRNWQRALADGENGVALIRAAIRYFQRLDVIVARVATGQSPRQAVTAHKPPIFWRDVDKMVTLASYWSPRAVQQILAGLLEAEQHCKSSNYDDLVMAGWQYNRIAAAAKNLRGRKTNYRAA